MKEDVFVFGPSAVAQLVWDVGKKSNKKKEEFQILGEKKKGARRLGSLHVQGNRKKRNH